MNSYVTMSQTKKHSVDLKKITITYLEDGILENYLKPNQIIEKEDINILRQHNPEIAGNIPYAILLTMGEGAEVTQEARELVASKEIVGIKLAKAILTKNLAQRIIGNFYLAANKPKFKTKLFTDREKALEWLREIVKMNRASD